MPPHVRLSYQWNGAEEKKRGKEHSDTIPIYRHLFIPLTNLKCLAGQTQHVSLLFL